MFDEQTANDLLKQIRDFLDTFNRVYSDRIMTSDLWAAIDFVDHLAHGGDKFSSLDEEQSCISKETSK